MLTGCSTSGSGAADPSPSVAASSAASPDTPEAKTSPSASDSPEPSASPSGSPTARATAGSATGSVRIERTIADGLNVPWGLALLPGGDLLMTSRDDRTITRIDLATGGRTVIGTIDDAVSNVTSGGEAGLLGIAVSPTFGSDRHIFVYYSTADDNRIARLTYDPRADHGRQLSHQKVILSDIPHGLHHDGGRIAFGPDGRLYASTGEAGEPSLSQDKSSLGGKILRMTASGAPAPGNPDPDSVIWSIGHRNVQGLAWDPAGRLWASEFGDKSADELNLIKPARNYGWPDTQGRTDDRRFTGPVAQWGTDEDSPSGIAYAAGAIWMAALQGERLWRIPLDGAEPVAAPQDFLNGDHGRLRSVLAVDADSILVSTSNTDGRADPGAGDDRLLLLQVS
ncbi:Glucose/arabinose dehydrogenase, beta-propeller fold [Microlunatus soli]|uniref:Glucose/arabinose dehydrogenase, beta-propeller fold n=1 Tax=Microlunatus soli TaxID=630515 RepID=A0A1H1RLD6_9ACTN|nr:Glucose/arabinose dehydrogenase, beta-propeller fold [Microlunatus soli]